MEQHQDKKKFAADGPGETSRRKKSAAVGPGDADQTDLIGTALKSVYQNTVNEDIPLDFAELLNRLK